MSIAEPAYNSTLRFVKRKQLFVVVILVSVITMTSYLGRSEVTLFQFNNNTNALVHTSTIVGDGLKTLLYPGDFTLESNIRSAELVARWRRGGNCSDARLRRVAACGNFRYQRRHVGDNGNYCSRLTQTVSGKKSRMSVLRYDSHGNVYVRIDLVDKSGKRINHGGDVLFVWAKGDNDWLDQNNDRVAATIHDHLNGTYIARLHMLWNGTASIRCSIVAKSGVSCLRLRALDKYGDSKFATKSSYLIFFRFQNQNATESVRCGPTPRIPNYSEYDICNLTGFNFNLSWFCGRPKHPSLRCTDFNSYRMAPYNRTKVLPNQGEDEVINVHIPLVVRLKSVLKLRFNTSHEDAIVFAKLPCRERSPQTSWKAQPPTGYFRNGHWMETNCQNTVVTTEAVQKCLRGKQLVFIGDSTIRQYIEDLSELLKMDFVRNKSHGTAVDRNLFIAMEWHKHEMPYHNLEWAPRGDLNSTAHQIRLLADATTTSGLVLTLTYNSHLQSFSSAVYRSRIRAAVESVKYLLRKRPDARVFFKGPHAPVSMPKWFDARVTLLFRDVIFEEFGDIRENVVYLDTLSISIAHASLLLHPKEKTLRSQTEQLLSYLC